jgi:hypothetical protein
MGCGWNRKAGKDEKMKARMRKKLQNEIDLLDESVQSLAKLSDEDPEFDDIQEQKIIKDAKGDINSGIAKLEALIR